VSPTKEIASCAAQLYTPPFATQKGVPPLQARPQIPQFDVVVRSVSQPSSGLPLQLAQLASHTGAQSKAPGVPVQLVEPCELVQALPHALQWVTLPSVVSQPFAGWLSQLPKPAVQVPRVQVPVEHDSEALAKLHGTSQSPQLVSVRMSRSQPFVATPSQLFQPASHVGTQPFVVLQVVPPCAFEHTSVHERQAVVVPRVVSQPAAAVQSAKPALHEVRVQAPVLHEAVAFGNEQA